MPKAAQINQNRYTNYCAKIQND